ncbi:MAG: cell division topological specificity factor MinE [Anaerolineaceae bacterium]|nr:cell division topological specificity factor MinE [Anaerolineaceae bacterium]
MPGFFDRLRGRSSNKSSSSLAKERLQVILVHDRISLPQEKLQAMKEEILAVISKYVSVRGEDVDIALQHRNRGNLLIAEIPFSQRDDGVKDEARLRMAHEGSLDDDDA